MFAVNLCSYDTINSEIIDINKDGVVKFTDYQQRVCWLYFNEVFNGVSSEAKFNSMKSNLKSFIDGKTVCILTHGSTGSGKSCTMFGFGNEVGILHQSVSEILKCGTIVLTVFEIIDKDRFDLIVNDGIKIRMTNDSKPNTKQIQSSDEFSQTFQQVLALRAQKSTDQNATSSRSHLIVKISLKNNSNCIVFADLAGFESAKNKENLSETQFINSSLSGFNQVMLSMSRNEKPNFKANTLTKCLQPFINANAVMFYHVNAYSMKTSLEMIKDIMASQKGQKRLKPQASSQPNKIQPMSNNGTLTQL
ncbi:protein claret segregational-like, partial [Contarinia nasturtii]|uniref:protein claret segregational-like n=1 Tax=Contarinia nasturtii TaxID=265458 RepID=UPI0012D3D395